MSNLKGVDLGIVIPATPTLASLGAAKSTTGPGLPSFTGRRTGDLHHNETNGLEYVLTGTVGATVVDNFNRPDGALGSFTSGATYTWQRSGGNPDTTISGDKAGQPGFGGSATNPYIVLTGADTAPLTVSVTVAKELQVGVSARDAYTVTNQNGRLNLYSGIDTYATRLSYADANTDYASLANGSPVFVTLTIGGTSTVTIHATITDAVTGEVYTTLDYVDNAPAGSPQPRVGFYINGGYTLVDDFTVVNNGTLAWTLGVTNTKSTNPVATTGLAAPVQSALTTSTTGGTGLAATTAYFYEVTALNAAGETTGSNEQTITTGAGTTNSNVVSWAAIAHATGYRIYRGTATGAESVYYAVGAVTTYTDTGAASTAGTVPVANTSGTTITLPDVDSATVHRLTLTASITLVFPALVSGKSFTVVSLQDSTGGRIITWPSTVRWQGDVAPTQTVAANKRDIYSFLCENGLVWLGFVAGQNYSP